MKAGVSPCGVPLQQHGSLQGSLSQIPFLWEGLGRAGGLPSSAEGQRDEATAGRGRSEPEQDREWVSKMTGGLATPEVWDWPGTGAPIPGLWSGLGTSHPSPVLP